MGLHSKPLIMVNVDGYWDPLRSLLDHVISHGFAEGSLNDLVQWAGSIPEAMDLLKTI